MDRMETVRFTLGGLCFEYDEKKNRKNIEKHGISFRNAARVFFDYDRIELFDDENSRDEDRYNVIGDTSAGIVSGIGNTIIGSPWYAKEEINDILFVFYTERTHIQIDGNEVDVIRIISARMATSFERGVYYGKY